MTNKVGAQQAELGTIIKDEAAKEQRARWEAERREKLTADERHAESMRKQDEIRDAILASPAIGLGNGGR